MKIYSKKIGYVLFFILTCFLIEMMTFSTLKLGIMPKYFFMEFSVILLLSSFIFLMKSEKLIVIYESFIILIFILLYIANTTMFKMSGDVFSLKYINLFGEATKVFDPAFLSIKSIVFGIILFSIAVILLINYYNRIEEKRLHHFSFFKGLLSFVFLLGISVLVFSSQVERVYKTNSEKVEIMQASSSDEYFRFSVSVMKMSSFQEYGMMSFYFEEFKALNLSGNATVDEHIKNLNYFKKYEMNTNEFTGLLKGKNVITVMIESGQDFAINEVLTPNIWKLRANGIQLNNNYSRNKTNVSEMIGIAGSYPSGNFTPTITNYELPQTIPSILNEYGYKTSYFHDNVPKFYSRGDLIPQLGFENYYFHEEIHPDKPMWTFNGNYILDSVTAEAILPKLTSTNEPFYSFWTTLSTHGPYDSNYENINKFTNLGYFDAIDKAEDEGKWENILNGKGLDLERKIRYYQAAWMDLDKAVGLIIEDLKGKNIFDDTLFIFYGDHNVYYHDLHLAINDKTESEFYYTDLYKTTMFIYNEDVTNKMHEVYNIKKEDSVVVDNFTSPYIIVPTILDLLGIKYNSGLYLGKSLFNTTNNIDNIFYSHQGGLFNQQVFTNDGATFVYQKEEYDADYLEQLSKRATNLLIQQNYINSMYISNLFNVIDYDLLF